MPAQNFSVHGCLSKSVAVGRSAGSYQSICCKRNATASASSGAMAGCFYAATGHTIKDGTTGHIFATTWQSSATFEYRTGDLYELFFDHVPRAKTTKSSTKSSRTWGNMRRRTCDVPTQR